ncbi:hypothetical protein N7509_013393 [Penicillium cosmopolitanum]|uniref:Uncharacterized protein n=1 Tax=Penicillium cosmopolitanum TaxID=1131564 RepID=A0A9W9SD81_9EURO|nr:uncharacterized protein N7509_013393 [Penicillium cosmopolitanum]KAJ5376507.1 hypothetical protein N7509_013393 [Penicillium cosmopolitanum]
MDIGHGTLIAMWVTFGVASTLFWARLLVQINIVKRLGRDDYLMLAAWIAINSFTNLSGTILAVDLTYPLHLEPATKIMFMLTACLSIL